MSTIEKALQKKREKRNEDDSIDKPRNTIEKASEVSARTTSNRIETGTK